MSNDISTFQLEFLLRVIRSTPTIQIMLNEADFELSFWI